MAAQADSLAGVVGEKTAAILGEEIGVHTIGELLRYFPMRYVRQGQLSSTRRPENGEWVTLVARVEKADLRPMRNKRGKLLSIKATDGTISFGVTFFNPYAIQRALRPGVRFMVAGTVSYYREQMQLTHPNWMVLPDEGADIETVGSSMMLSIAGGDTAAGDGPDGDAGGASSADLADFHRPFLPVYPATKALQTWDIWRAVRKALDVVDPIEDPLTDADRDARGLIGSDESLRAIHLPETAEDIEAAGARLKFDEALALQLSLAQRRFADLGHRGPAAVHVDGGLEDALLGRLPFELTGGQDTVIDEICTQLGSGEPMSRLLQGEVGSGKTLVALIAMLRMIDNDFQCVLLAPTEVLAAQHHRSLTKMLGGLAQAGELGAEESATRIALLTGSMKTAGKRAALLEAVTGTAGIVIGTHALLEDHVDFFNLGLIVVDEQHRFGVEQRDTLRSRGRDDLIPHMLVMTATPIPRTIAMTVYGDLETSTLRELPAGRQPITTNVVPTQLEKWENRLWQVVDEEVGLGRQVYVVCSRIGDDGTAAGAKSEERAAEQQGPQTTSVVEMFDQIVSGPLGRHRVELLHGRMSGDDKTATMDAFTRGEIDILVSTTVIEVGVDVANANAMVIVDAERFGVSQLHQLRGRVGRGGLPGRCFLRTAVSPTSSAMERLRAVEASNDGFELARIDLIQRREGDVLGAVQSGVNSSLRFLSLLDDADVIADARELAAEVVSGDLTLLDHRPMADLVDAVLGPGRIQYLEKS
ncbi:ATP-dependent DNA helicase RecG [Williamsia phyllosphaerae]|uniref:Probable DNA 3'-5' helicase RecG n=1 Tax=Williamsia phyllosphaerae TaxID=885042 RepID=A0ABQ1UVC7_9NOCA|nr:ATP-dependent DNA helicase RecG [Williamsia phyllosphaerae]GGF28058.1 ATP-dependent DNA helicase RecG [Williamsia phyllosphaerae]